MPGKKPLFSQKMVNPRSGTVRFSTGEARQGSWLVERQAGGLILVDFIVTRAPACRVCGAPAADPLSGPPCAPHIFGWQDPTTSAGPNISHFRNCEKVNMWGEEGSAQRESLSPTRCQSRGVHEVRQV